MRTPPGAQPERDVLERRQVGEQQVVLEHDADRALLGRDEDVGRRVVDDDAVERDPAASIGQQAGERPQHRRLAGAVGAEDGEHSPGLDRELDVEVERAELQRRSSRVERHADAPGRAAPPPSQRSRSPTSTANETAISTRLRMSASSGFVSSAR